MIPGSLRALFLKNAFANVVGGAGTALFNLLLPALVVRHLAKLEFSVWTLAMQVLVYVQVFGFGLQTVITYYIAKSNAENDVADQRATIRAAMTIASYFCTVALVVVGLLVVFYPVFFDDVPAPLMNDFRMCVALLGLSAVAQLAALIPIGAFTGLHRNIVPVSIQMAVRFTSLAALWGVSQVGGGLLALSITLAVCGFMVVPATFGTARRLAGQMFEKFPPLDRERVNAMLKDCMGLAVWSVAMLLVGGLDVVIVGHFDFAKVAAFSLASTAVTIFVGVLQAMLNPLIALGSSMTARKGGGGGLDRLLVVSTHSCAAFLVSITLLFALIGHFVLPYWVSKTYVEDVYSFLLVLLIAQSVRNLMAPYSVLLVSVRRQREALVPAIVEGLVNLVCSVYLVNKLGAMGAAYGTLIGAIVGVLAFVLLVVHRTRELVKSRLQFVTRVLVLPLFSLVAVFLLSVR